MVFLQNGWLHFLGMFWKDAPIVLYSASEEEWIFMFSWIYEGLRSSKPNCVSRCYILYPSVSNQYECWSMLVSAAGSCLLCSVYSRHKSLVAGVKNSLWTLQSRQKLMQLQPSCSSVQCSTAFEPCSHSPCGNVTATQHMFWEHMMMFKRLV